MTKKYQEKEWLQQRVNERLTHEEIAELAGCSGSTVSLYINELSIKGEHEKYKNSEWLYEQYHDKGLSFEKIADKLGVGSSTIENWMKKHGIERRTPDVEKPPHYGRDSNGYPRWSTTVGDSIVNVHEHRLLAALEWGVEEIKGKDVHHKSGIRWDNRPDNLELMSRSEHAKMHAENRESN